MGTGEPAASPLFLPEKEEKIKERLCQVIVTFEVGKERVDSEVLLGAGENGEAG